MYVALTRAKREAMLSFAELRRVWGKTENTLPSRFLREIEADYLEPNFRLEELSGRGRMASLIAEDDDDDDYESYNPRRSRFAEGRAATQRSAYGESQQRPAMSRPSFERRSQPTTTPRPQSAGAPRAEIITTPPPIDPRRAGMRSVGVRQSDADVTTAPSPAVAGCPYAVGDRVEHPKFGVGVVERIEMLATDHKIVVAFASYGSKTLLANFAKLTKL